MKRRNRPGKQLLNHYKRVLFEVVLEKKSSPKTGTDVMCRSIFYLIFFIGICSPAIAEDLVKLRPYVRQISFTGFTRPVQELSIAAEINGKCTAVLVDVGNSVGDGGVVAEIDATFVRLDLEKNKLAQKQTGLQLVLANKTLARFQKLINKKSTAQATYDETVLSAEELEVTLKILKNEEKRLAEQLKRHTLYAPVVGKSLKGMSNLANMFVRENQFSGWEISTP